jgi:hypothetical protein
MARANYLYVTLRTTFRRACLNSGRGDPAIQLPRKTCSATPLERLQELSLILLSSQGYSTSKDKTSCSAFARRREPRRCERISLRGGEFELQSPPGEGGIVTPPEPAERPAGVLHSEPLIPREPEVLSLLA